ncbi:hypothetical protein ABZ333_28975, partial [Streptomyces olivaceus]
MTAEASVGIAAGSAVASVGTTVIVGRVVMTVTGIVGSGATIAVTTVRRSVGMTVGMSGAMTVRRSAGMTGVMTVGLMTGADSVVGSVVTIAVTTALRSGVTTAATTVVGTTTAGVTTAAADTGVGTTVIVGRVVMTVTGIVGSGATIAVMSGV